VAGFLAPAAGLVGPTPAFLAPVTGLAGLAAGLAHCLAILRAPPFWQNLLAIISHKYLYFSKDMEGLPLSYSNFFVV
jgi:hypothetical protein